MNVPVCDISNVGVAISQAISNDKNIYFIISRAIKDQIKIYQKLP